MSFKTGNVGNPSVLAWHPCRALSGLSALFRLSVCAPLVLPWPDPLLGSVSLCLVLNSFLEHQLRWSLSPPTPGYITLASVVSTDLSDASLPAQWLSIFLSSVAGTSRVVTLGQDTRKSPFYWNTWVMGNLFNFSWKLQFLSHVEFGAVLSLTSSVFPGCRVGHGDCVSHTWHPFYICCSF